jgi:hypothetical protein
MHDWARNAEFFLAEIAHLLFGEPFDVADTIKSRELGTLAAWAPGSSGAPSAKSDF